MLQKTYITEVQNNFYIPEKITFRFPHVCILGAHYCGKNSAGNSSTGNNYTTFCVSMIMQDGQYRILLTKSNHNTMVAMHQF